jgi:serine/threonine protein kinase
LQGASTTSSPGQSLAEPFPSNAHNQRAVIKSIRHVRLENERNILKRFQDVAPVRPLVDEIQEPQEPPGIVLKHYDCHVGEVANKKGFSPREIRNVSRRVLEALRALHENGFVHSGSSRSVPNSSCPSPLGLTALAPICKQT